MKPLRKFEDFLKEGIVKKQRIDVSRAADLVQEAEKRRQFIKDMEEKIVVSDANANYFVENIYDTIMELIRAKMFLDGFKAAGLSAHEAEVSYLRKLKFSEADIRFSNELRYYRNGVVYYGKSMNAEYANKVLKFLNEKYSHLMNIATPKKQNSQSN
ncbi:MAG TPA: hypothetical protein VJH04_03785 [archaeon]|nr:hypothetical protein [archaeon]